MLRFLTAGESHGRELVVILDGVPSGLLLDFGALARELRRRQGGYGRGRRMSIEADAAVVVGGIRRGCTTGAPIALSIQNRDWVNWEFTMHPDEVPPADAGGARRAPVTRPRPGHADLAGAIKDGHGDLRDVIERASARETAARVAAGAVARQILAQVSIAISSHVVAIGPVSAVGSPVAFDRIAALPDDSPTRCVDDEAAGRMIAAIDAAREAGDTLGGAFEVIARGVPAGLGSYAQWDRRLDGRLAQALMSIPAIKAVGIGIGPEVARLQGSQVHDEIVLTEADAPAGSTTIPFARPTNNAGGLEGGVTNGQDLRVTAYMKPISTLMSPLRSVDLVTREEGPAAIERSDVCAVPAASVVGEAMVALVLADALLDRFGGDSIADLRQRHAAWRQQVHDRFPRPDGSSHLVIRPIVKYGEHVLHREAENVTGISPDLADLVRDMIETMYAAPGVGLAAPQVGVPVRVFVIDVTGGRSRDGLLAFVNPEFVERDGMQLEEEGCLSVPGFNATVARPSRAVVKGLDLDGHERIVEGTGLLARAFQHEMDHLDGRVFVDRLRGIQRDLIVRRIRKLTRTGKW